jgi:signal transduction histidine kinase
MEANAGGHHLTVDTGDPEAVIEADRQILASIIANLLQNAYKYTRPHSHVTLRTITTADHVTIEVEDDCGGLPPEKLDQLFKPIAQASADHNGLGLGLAICMTGVGAIGGDRRSRPSKQRLRVQRGATARPTS